METLPLWPLPWLISYYQLTLVQLFHESRRGPCASRESYTTVTLTKTLEVVVVTGVVRCLGDP